MARHELGIGIERHPCPEVAHLVRIVVVFDAIPLLAHESPDFVQLQVLAPHALDSVVHEALAALPDAEGEPGDVMVFELEGHPEATRCYAWEVDGQVTTVLGVGPVKSAQDAVKASILADAEQDQ